jgi:hypothetical protein
VTMGHMAVYRPGSTRITNSILTVGSSLFLGPGAPSARCDQPLIVVDRATRSRQA